MITIKFSPVRKDRKTSASFTGTVFTIGGESFDLSLLNDGDSGVHETLLEFSRDGDNYEVKIQLSHGAKAPLSTRFPVNVTKYGDWVLDYDFGDA